MRPADAHGSVPGQTGLAATEVGDAVHRLLELVELAAPAPPGRAELEEHVRAWYPAATVEELDRIAGFVTSYCESELARRIARLAGARPCSTTRRTRWPRGRRRRSWPPTTGCSGSSMRSPASAAAPTRSRSSTTS